MKHSLMSRFPHPWSPHTASPEWGLWTSGLPLCWNREPRPLSLILVSLLCLHQLLLSHSSTPLYLWEMYLVSQLRSDQSKFTILLGDPGQKQWGWGGGGAREGVYTAAHCCQPAHEALLELYLMWALSRSPLSLPPSSSLYVTLFQSYPFFSILSVPACFPFFFFILLSPKSCPFSLFQFWPTHLPSLIAPPPLSYPSAPNPTPTPPHTHTYCCACWDHWQTSPCTAVPRKEPISVCSAADDLTEILRCDWLL